jgi:hypothetical protein
MWGNRMKVGIPAKRGTSSAFAGMGCGSESFLPRRLLVDRSFNLAPASVDIMRSSIPATRNVSPKREASPNSSAQR